MKARFFLVDFYWFYFYRNELKGKQAIDASSKQQTSYHFQWIRRKTTINVSFTIYLMVGVILSVFISVCAQRSVDVCGRNQFHRQPPRSTIGFALDNIKRVAGSGWDWRCCYQNVVAKWRKRLNLNFVILHNARLLSDLLRSRKHFLSFTFISFTWHFRCIRFNSLNIGVSASVESEMNFICC